MGVQLFVPSPLLVINKTCLRLSEPTGATLCYSNSDVIELIGGIEKPYETEVVELKEAKHDQL